MENVAETLKRCHAIMWRYRREMQGYWPTPSTRDAARFAVCETCEALDASLRLNSGYARNNAKDLSIEDELCDALMMLITAIGPRLYAWGVFESLTHDDWEGRTGDLDQFVIDAANVLRRCDLPLYDRTWREHAWMLCGDITKYVGESTVSRLTARLERIKAKHWREWAMQPQDTNDAYANALLRHAGECE